jgi:thiol:disulfide interchange protein DsbA
MKHLLSLVAACLFAATALAQEPQLGKDYTLIDPPLQTLAPAGKIEVFEFFSYGCPHCNEINPVVKQWVAKQPSDVSFRKVPVSFGRPAWERLSAIYYALEMSNNLKLDQAVFEAVHGERINFASNEKIIEWAVSKGADKAKFSDALNSFGMQARIRRGDQDAQASRMNGVPAFVVAGRYLVPNAPDLFKTVDALVVKVRKESGGK